MKKLLLTIPFLISISFANPSGHSTNASSASKEAINETLKATGKTAAAATGIILKGVGATGKALSEVGDDLIKVSDIKDDSNLSEDKDSPKNRFKERK